MSLITKKNIEELIKVKNEYCISIIIPTEVVGENAESKIMLKNQLTIIEKQLEDKGKKPKEISELLSPAKELLDNSELWRNLSDALFIYRSEKLFSTYTLALDTEEFSMVSDRFYILPLLSALKEDGRFFLLMISMNQNQLFECDQSNFKEVETGDFMPDSILDSVGRDVEQKSLQFRSGQTGQNTGMYHGKGEGKDDKKKELRKYLQRLDKGLNTLLEGYNIPLVVSSVDYVFSIFRDISSYENVYPENVSGNVDEENIADVHENAESMPEPGTKVNAILRYL